MRLFICLFATILLLSCSSNKDSSVHFINKDFRKEAKLVKGELVRFEEELIYANRYFVYDTLLIVRNNLKSETEIVEFRNLHTGKLLKSIFAKGEGPDELLSAQLYLSDNILTVKDIMRDRVSFVNIDSLMLSNHYKPVWHNYNSDYHVLDELNDSCMVMLNSYKYRNDKLGINIDAPRLEVAKKGDNSTRWLPTDFKYYPFNVTNGYIAVSRTHGKIMYACFGSPIMELYDNRLNLLKEIRIPDDYEKDLDNIRIKDDGSLVYRIFRPMASVCCRVVGDYFYTLYNGYAHDVRSFDPEKNQDPKYFPLIMKFDMDGNFVKSYKTDRYLFELSLSKDGKTAYTVGLDENGEFALFRYKLE